MPFRILNIIFICLFSLALVGCGNKPSTSQTAVKQVTSASTAKQYNKAQVEAHIKAHIADHHGDVAAANKHAEEFGGDHVKAHFDHHDTAEQAHAHAQQFEKK